MTNNNTFQYLILKPFINEFVQKLNDYILINDISIEVKEALELLLLRVSNLNIKLNNVDEDTNSDSIKDILSEIDQGINQDKLKNAHYLDSNFHQEKKIPTEIGNSLFCLMNLMPGGELEIGMLEDFYNHFKELSDIHVISIGSVGVKEQQIYPWLRDYSSKHRDESIQISLFDEYFFQKQGDTMFSYDDICERTPEFARENPDEWKISDNGHCFKNTNLNIQVNIYKSFFSWGFEQLVKPCVMEILAPMVISHIERGSKVIISQHTGGAVIDQSLKDLYDKAARLDVEDKLILFASNTLGSTPDSARNVTIQYYDKHEHYVDELSGFIKETTGDIPSDSTYTEIHQSTSLDSLSINPCDNDTAILGKVSEIG